MKELAMIDSLLFKILRGIGWCILAVLIGIVCGMLGGCFFRWPSVPGPGAQPPASALPGLAVCGSWLGGLAILAAIPVAIWVNRRWGIILGTSGLGIIIAAQLLAWVSANAALLAIVALVLGLAWQVLRLRADPRRLARVEKAVGIDLNRDGRIGA